MISAEEARERSEGSMEDDDRVKSVSDHIEVAVSSGHRGTRVILWGDNDFKERLMHYVQSKGYRCDIANIRETPHLYDVFTIALEW